VRDLKNIVAEYAKTQRKWYQKVFIVDPVLSQCIEHFLVAECSI
jgi:hypothetical protein